MRSLCMAHFYSYFLFPFSSPLILVPLDHFSIARAPSCAFLSVLCHFLCSLPHSTERCHTVLKLVGLVYFTWHYVYQVHLFFLQKFNLYFPLSPLKNHINSTVELYCMCGSGPSCVLDKHCTTEPHPQLHWALPSLCGLWVQKEHRSFKVKTMTYKQCICSQFTQIWLLQNSHFGAVSQRYFVPTLWTLIAII